MTGNPARHNSLRKIACMPLCFSLIFLLTSCGGGGSISSDLATLSTPKDVEFDKILGGAWSDFAEENFVVVTNQQEFNDIWEKTDTLGMQIPVVDFQTDIVIAVYSGHYRMGNYLIEVIKITEMINSVEVDVVKKSYTCQGYCIDDMPSRPYELIQTKKIDKPFIFKVTLK